MSSWTNATDPCDNEWAFVSCNCSSVYPPLSTAECSSVAADPGNRRVLVLEVGSVVRTQGRQLGGSISDALGSLTELRTLDLHGNRLEVSTWPLCCMPAKSLHAAQHCKCLCSRHALAL